MAAMSYQQQFYNKEIPFCKVYSLESKEKLEKIFLQNRISFFVEWQEQSILKRMFSADKERGKNVFVVRINEADAERARELVKGIGSIKIKKAEQKS